MRERKDRGMRREELDVEQGRMKIACHQLRETLNKSTSKHLLFYNQGQGVQVRVCESHLCKRASVCMRVHASVCVCVSGSVCSVRLRGVCVC